MPSLLKQLTEVLEPPAGVSEFETLRSAVLAFKPFADPAPEQIVAVAPQLSLDTAKHLLKQARRERVRFAGPPIASSEAYQCYTLATNGPNLVGMHRLCAFRTEGQFAYTGAAPIYGHEALKWSLDRAPAGKLLSHAFPTILMADFAYAADTEGGLADTCKLRLAAACSASPVDTLQDHDEPASELLDDTILQIASHQAEIDELTLGHTKVWFHFCAQCAGQLTDAGCGFCSERWNVRLAGRNITGVVAPRSLSAYAAQHIAFKHRPALARAREHERWAKAQFVGFVDDEVARTLRVIHVGD